MRIFITGGSGYIGGRIAQHLKAEGHDIVLGVRSKLSSQFSTDEFKIKQINWDDVSSLQDACSGAEVIIHAAGVNSAECALDPVAALMFNGVATARLVAAACRKNVQRFIYFSTVHVYGNPLVGIISDDTVPKNYHPYATSHLAGEHVLIGASRRGEIKGNVFRLTNIFGAPAHRYVNCWSLLVNSLCKDAIKFGQIRLQGNGSQHRSFMPMESFCNFLNRTLNDIDFKNHPEIINVGPDKSQSVLSMARKVQERCFMMSGIKIGLEYDELGMKNSELPFVCRSELCNKLGLATNFSDEQREIDNLLEFCTKEFD